MKALGTVSIVGAGPGNPDLITVRGLTCLREADVVLHDRLIDLHLLEEARPDAEVINVGKEPGDETLQQEHIDWLMIEKAREGKNVCRLKGGDPFVFGRGGEELAALAAAGVDTLVVPGVTSAVAAPALAGIPLTHREVASSVAFLTGHDPARLARAARAADTLVVLMALDRLAEITSTLAPILGAEHPAAVVSEAGLAGQRQVRSTLGELDEAVRAAGLQAPATLVVGRVVNVASVASRRLEERLSLIGAVSAGPMT
jgi:uroporphyrin-III C-methyltransferase